MPPIWKQFVMLLFAAGLSATGQQSISAAPSLSTQDPLKFTFPLPDSSITTFSFLLFSAEGDVAKASVQVREVKTPDGAALPFEAVRAALETDTVTPKGVRVSITLEPKYFHSPGDYGVVLFFQGETGTPHLTRSIVINRPAADINVEEVKDQTVTLTRWFPFMSASNEFPLKLQENTRKVPINDLQVVTQNIYVKDSKELVPGQVTATFLQGESAQTQAGAQGIKIDPGATGTFQVSLNGVRYAGSFDTRLLVTSPSFNGTKTIPVKLAVHDWFLFPLFAIGLGVLGAYWTRRLVSVVRPQNQNRLELLRLRNEVERFRELVKNAASIETVQSLLAQLSRARESNELGDFAAVRTELSNLRERLDAFRKAQIQAEGAAQSALSGLLNQVEVLEQGNTLTAEEARDLHSIKDKLADIERLLRLGMVEDAQIKIENVKPLLGLLRARKLISYFNELKFELSKLSSAAVTQSEALITEIQGLLNNNELDRVRLKLEELKSFIEEQKRRARAMGARDSEAEIAGLAEVPEAVAAAGPFTRIEIATPLEDRIAGAVITFNIVDVENIIQPGDELRWFFGDVGSFQVHPVNATHRYLQSDRYSVRVEVVRNGALEKTLSTMLTIAPGEIEQARAGLLQDILRNETVLSIIALVLAIIGGVIFLYSGKLFGTLVDYLMAVLWGFGLDNSVKGFAAVLGKISST